MDVSLHSTEELAVKTLANYVRSNWGSVKPEQDIPEDDDEAITEFFYESETEFFVLTEEEVDRVKPDIQSD